MKISILLIVFTLITLSFANYDNEEPVFDNLRNFAKQYYPFIQWVVDEFSEIHYHHHHNHHNNGIQQANSLNTDSTPSFLQEKTQVILNGEIPTNFSAPANKRNGQHIIHPPATLRVTLISPEGFVLIDTESSTFVDYNGNNFPEVLSSIISRKSATASRLSDRAFEETTKNISPVWENFFAKTFWGSQRHSFHITVRISVIENNHN